MVSKGLRGWEALEALEAWGTPRAGGFRSDVDCVLVVYIVALLEAARMNDGWRAMVLMYRCAGGAGYWWGAVIIRETLTQRHRHGGELRAGKGVTRRRGERGDEGGRRRVEARNGRLAVN
jgi:hypothetical protein